MWPTKPFPPAREAVLSLTKKIYFEKRVDLVEYNTSRNNHITQEDRPSTCSVSAHVALGQKSLDTPVLKQQPRTDFRNINSKSLY